MSSPTPPRGPFLITGSSTGIGRAAALRLARRGHPVWATARDVTALDQLAAAGCTVRPLDVTDPASAAAVVDEMERLHGSVGVLVNNAGYGEYGPVETISADGWRRQFETNLFGVVHLTQLVLPAMREAGRGRIVNVSSMGGRLTLPGGGAYHASKYALEAMSDALRYEVRGFGVGVVLIEPGPVRSDFVEEATAPTVRRGPYAAFATRVAERNAGVYGGRRGVSSAEDIAAVIERASLTADPRARYVIGATARALLLARSVLSDRLWDALLRRTFVTGPMAGEAEPKV